MTAPRTSKHWGLNWGITQNLWEFRLVPEPGCRVWVQAPPVRTSPPFQPVSARYGPACRAWQGHSKRRSRPHYSLARSHVGRCPKNSKRGLRGRGRPSRAARGPALTQGLRVVWDKARAGDGGGLSHPNNAGRERAEPAMARPPAAAGRGFLCTCRAAALHFGVRRGAGWCPASPLEARAWRPAAGTREGDPRDAGEISTRGDCAIACGSAQPPGWPRSRIGLLHAAPCSCHPCAAQPCSPPAALLCPFGSSPQATPGAHGVPRKAPAAAGVGETCRPRRAARPPHGRLLAPCEDGGEIGRVKA